MSLDKVKKKVKGKNQMMIVISKKFIEFVNLFSLLTLKLLNN